MSRGFGLVVAATATLPATLLGIRHDYGGWLFVAPFLTAAGFALVFGASMRPAQGLVASAVLAAVLIVAFGLGLDARYWFADPSLRQGFETWVGDALADRHTHSLAHRRRHRPPVAFDEAPPGRFVLAGACRVAVQPLA